MADGGWKNSPVVAVIAVVALVAAGIFIVARMGGGGGGNIFTGSKFFLDLSSGQLVTSDSMKSPTQTPDGHEAVRAHVFSCSSCDDKSSHFVGYVRQFTPEANAAMDIPAEKREPFVIETGTLVSAYSDDAGWKPAWVKADTGPGLLIQESARAKCGDKYAECKP